MSVPTQARWLTVERAAEYLGCSSQTIRSAMHRGDLRASRLGPAGAPYLLDRIDIDRFLERRKRVLPPYRRGSKPWVKKRHVAQRSSLKTKEKYHESTMQEQ
jgi:excisionase family DNA binding protein